MLFFVIGISLPVSAQIAHDTMRGTGQSFENWHNRTKDVDAPGSAYLSLDLGASRDNGEYIRLHANLGNMGGFTLFGGIGKDWLFGDEDSEKLLWHAGVGYYLYFEDEQSFYNAHQFEFNVLYGKSAVANDDAVRAELGYIFFPGFASNRLGFRLNGGCGYALDSEKTTWDVGIGIRLKIFTNGQTKPKYKRSYYDY